MKRRELLRYTTAGLTAAIATTTTSQWESYQAQGNNGVTIQWLGHSCFLFTGSNLRILVNPFRPIGCTSKYRLPKVQTDLVLISSFLLDEGAFEIVPGKPKVIAEPGDYEFRGMKIQGVSVAHDRMGGNRFGNNVAWRWNQGGVKILHLGGAAAPIELEQKILIGTPDILLIPVGGGDKIYNAEEAKQVITSLNPKVIIPTQYLTQAANKNTCNLAPVDQFLSLAQGIPVKRLNTDKIAIKPGDLPKQSPVIRVFNYSFS